MANRTPKDIRIGIFLDIPGLARSRAISGLYRFAREKPNWRLYQFPLQRDSPALRDLAANFAVDAVLAGHADVVRAYADAGRETPFVLLESIEPSPSNALGAALNVDNVQLGLSAAERLHALGYRNLGYLGIVFNATPANESRMLARSSRLRGSAFERKATELNAPCSCFYPDRTTFAVDESSIRRWVSALPKPCGILAFSDEDAQYLIHVCRALKISIPGQVGIIGIDNEAYICDNVSPTLTSIEPDYEGAGYRAGELLDEFLTGKRTHVGAHERYGVALIENRMSAQSISTSANRVARALEIIRADPAKAPAPTALARQMNLSLRVLELAFKQILGHGIMSEILTQRLALAKRLIKTSRLGFGEIAFRCGFSSYPAFLASFKRRVGASPRDWRGKR